MCVFVSIKFVKKSVKLALKPGAPSEGLQQLAALKLGWLSVPHAKSREMDHWVVWPNFLVLKPSPLCLFGSLSRFEVVRVVLNSIFEPLSVLWHCVQVGKSTALSCRHVALGARKVDQNRCCSLLYVGLGNVNEDSKHWNMSSLLAWACFCIQLVGVYLRYICMCVCMWVWVCLFAWICRSKTTMKLPQRKYSVQQKQKKKKLNWTNKKTLLRKSLRQVALTLHGNIKNKAISKISRRCKMFFNRERN